MSQFSKKAAGYGHVIRDEEGLWGDCGWHCHVVQYAWDITWKDSSLLVDDLLLVAAAHKLLVVGRERLCRVELECFDRIENEGLRLWRVSLCLYNEEGLSSVWWFLSLVCIFCIPATIRYSSLDLVLVPVVCQALSLNPDPVSRVKLNLRFNLPGIPVPASYSQFRFAS